MPSPRLRTQGIAAPPTFAYDNDLATENLFSDRSVRLARNEGVEVSSLPPEIFPELDDLIDQHWEAKRLPDNVLIYDTTTTAKMRARS